MIKKLIRNIAKRFGQEIHSTYDLERQKNYTKLLEQFILHRPNVVSNLNQNTSIVIFSKDRAMQLDALLRSFYFYSNEAPKINVLYHSSSLDFEKAYSKLITEYKDREIVFTKEKHFKNDLINLFENLKDSKVLFLVDDIIFKNQFDFKQFRNINPIMHIASLRHGKHLNYCYTLAKKQALAKFDTNTPKQGFLSWDWNLGEHDWAYPLSLDGHLFDKEEMKILINELDYKAPNSLEQALQVMNPLYKKRSGLCYEQSIIVNNPCNKVQIENDNIHGESQIEDLNNKWLSGLKINFKEFEGILNDSAHQDLIYTFVKDE